MPEALGLGSVQDLLNSSAYPGGGFRFCDPDRFQNRQDVIGRDGIHELGPQRSRVGLQRRFPLGLVFFVLETCRQGCPHVIGYLAKGGNATVPLALLNWVKPLGNFSPRTGCPLAGVSEGDTGGAA